jgi:glycosyltransferase involved in cell wall biosynthesis
MALQERPRFLNGLRSTAGRLALAGTDRFLQRQQCPAVSVIILTHNRASYLERTLTALMRQCLSAATWEVLVVDRGSRDGTPQLIDQFGLATAVQVRAIRVPEDTGTAEQLNRGIEAARGSVLVFLMDDRLVRSDFLARHAVGQTMRECVTFGDDHMCVCTHLIVPNDVAEPGIQPTPLVDVDVVQDERMLQALTLDGPDDYRPLFTFAAKRHRPIPHPWACTTLGNLSMARSSVETIGAFDQRFDGWMLEGLDLAYRFHCAGIPFRYDPEAVALRQLSSPTQRTRRDALQQIHYLLGKHPGMSTVERMLVWSSIPGIQDMKD